MPDASSIRHDVHVSIKSLTDEALATTLLEKYDELVRRFDLGDFRPTELEGGRFSEAAFRVCEKVCFGKYTHLSKSLPKTDNLIRNLEQVPANSVDDTFRLHIPRTIKLIYNLRNKRDVAHLGAGVSPNFSDSSLILSCASWVMAEIIRVSHQCDMNTAQSIVDTIVQRRTPLIWSEEKILRVLNPSLSYRDQILLVLHHLQPEWVDQGQLFQWLEHSNLSVFKKKVLKPLHDEAMIHLQNGKAKILPPGNLFVESHLSGKNL